MIDSNIVVEVIRDVYHSHTTLNPDKSDWEVLEVHLREVAELTSRFAKKIGLEYEGYVSGLLHDIGKYSEKMQSRFEDNSIKGINHWSNGALQAIRLGWRDVGFCIQGHHVGLPNYGEFGSLLRKLSVVGFYEKITGFQEPHESLINKFLKRGMEMPREMKGGRGCDFSASFNIRMLFSCLVDADRTCTSNFSNGVAGKVNPFTEYPTLQPIAALDILMAEVSKRSSNTTLGRLRNQTLQDCLAGAERPSDIFTLTVPTGGSKTISSIAFAMKHAAKYEKKKVIYVLPFTTIIDQTGVVLTEDPENPERLTLKYNKHFGEDYILEHHSSIEVDNNEMEKYRVATSNWGNPVIVTTTVQFFESLFSNRTTPCQKLHNLPDSVIVFDEVQTLPPKLLKSLLTAVQVLVKEYRCTVVFCSATVPAFESVNLDVPWNPTEICSQPEEMSVTLKRCDIVLKREKITHIQLANQMLKHNQCLTVVNTKHDCQVIFELLRNKEGCYHLSTNMCALHRKKVIAEFPQRLRSGLSCRVVSTQLIEAGVDVDFPHGFRIFAPLDSIIQTAGRINREGKLEMGTLEVVGLIDGRSPRGNYQTRIGITQSFLNQNRDLKLHSPETYREYYKQMYSLVGKETDNVFEASKNLQFQTVNDECKIIDDLTVSVIVPYGDGQSYIDQIQRDREVPKWMYRKLQLVSVNVYRNKLQQMLDDDVVRTIQCGDSTIHYLRPENYNEVTGMTWNPLEPQDFIL